MVNQVNTPASAPGLSAGSMAAPVVTRSAPIRTGTLSAPTLGKGPGSNPGVQDAAVAQVNQHLQQAQPELKMQMDSASGRPVFQVIQQGTGQVVLQVPSEEVLGMSRRLRELEGLPGASGALVDKEG
ncbi:MAG: flagellar protein FlaG [Holophaga sp.]|nr:flagellar protein FlaG [Holophaga sp.]